MVQQFLRRSRRSTVVLEDAMYISLFDRGISTFVISLSESSISNPENMSATFRSPAASEIKSL